MNENFRRLLNDATRQMAATTSGIDHAGDKAFVEVLGISNFDMRQLDEGRITGPMAGLHDALAGVEAAAGLIEKEPSRRPWIEMTKADGDLSRTAKSVAKWLDGNGDGEVNLQAIGSSLHASVKAVRAALDELLSWGYVDLRPSVRTGAIRVKIIR